MSSDETDIHHLISIVYPYHQPVFVTGDIEYHPAVSKNAGIKDHVQSIDTDPIDLCFSNKSPSAADYNLFNPISLNMEKIHAVPFRRLYNTIRQSVLVSLVRPPGNHMSALELKIPPVALVLFAGAAMWFVSAVAPSFTLQLPFKQAIALVLPVAGAFVAVWGVVSFRRVGTTVNPTKPQATSSLVSTGSYRFSRNPMYLGFLLALVGWAVFLANALAFVLVPLFVMYMNRFQITPEERALSALFGTEFSAYRQRVRRWV